MSMNFHELIQSEVSHSEVINRDFYVRLAKKVKINALPKILGAGNQRSWNKLVGKIPNKNDLRRELDANLRIINDYCLEDGYESIYTPAEDKPIEVGNIG